MRLGLVLLAATIIGAPGAAHAGRTFYGWLYGSEVMPARGVELQSWITEENFGERAETSWLFAAQVGVTDRLELGFPVELDWSREDVTVPVASTSTQLARFGIEARYRFVAQPGGDGPAITPLVRVAAKRLVAARDMMQPELDVVVSYESGIVHVLADLGAVAQVGPGDQGVQLRPGAGVSVLVAAELRVGAEAFAQIPDEGDAWVIAGPNLSWTHGRFWISGAFGIGIVRDRIHNAPRVQLGIAF